MSMEVKAVVIVPVEQRDKLMDEPKTIVCPYCHGMGKVEDTPRFTRSVMTDQDEQFLSVYYGESRGPHPVVTLKVAALEAGVPYHSARWRQLTLLHRIYLADLTYFEGAALEQLRRWKPLANNHYKGLIK